MDLLATDAHRHPYIERLGMMYMMKLRHGSKFGRKSGSIWRLLFVFALMPWLRKHRLSSNEEPEEIEDEQDVIAPTGTRELERDIFNSTDMVEDEEIVISSGKIEDENNIIAPTGTREIEWDIFNPTDKVEDEEIVISSGKIEDENNITMTTDRTEDEDSIIIWTGKMKDELDIVISTGNIDFEHD